MEIYYAGGLILGAVVWIVCAVYAYQNAPRLGRNAWLWAIICIVLGPIGLMILFVLPNKTPIAGSGHAAAKKSEQESLYEVPKKHH